MQELFLDANAHVSTCYKALQSSIEFNNSIAGHGHPSSPNPPGRAAATALEEARAKIAKLIGAHSPNNIVFTNSCTQACEWAMELFKGIPGEFLGQNNHIAISPTEHPAIYQAYNKVFGKEAYFNSNDNGKYINSEYYNKIVSIHLQNETGLIQPISEMNTKYLFCDMSQSLGKFPINLSQQNVDIAVFGAHKFGGPNGIGFIYLKDTSWWKPFGTGSRYHMDIAGTPNVAGIVASAVALEYALETLPKRMQNMLEFRNELEKGLKSLDIEIIAENEQRSWNTTFIRILGGKALYTMMQLGQEGIYVGLGSACGSLTSSSNPLMQRLGKPCDAYDFMRISQWGNYGAEEAKYFLDHFKRILSL